MALIQVTPPSTEPVTVADLRFHLRIPSTSQGGSSAENPYLGGLIKVARKQAENIMKRQICHATYQMTMPSFPSDSTGSITFLRPPLTTASTDISLTYLDSSGVSNTVDSTFYEVERSGNPRIYPAGSNRWSDISPDSRQNAVTLQYVSGYSSDGTSTSIPNEIRHWIMMQAGSLYENRTPLIEVRFTEAPRNVFDSLLDDFTIHGVVK